MFALSDASDRMSGNADGTGRVVMDVAMDVSGTVSKVKALFLQGQYEDVEQILKQSLSENAAHPELMNWLCNFYHHMRRFEELIDLFTGREIPDQCIATVIQAHRALKQHPQAIALLQAQGELSASQLLLLSVLLKEQGDAPRAAEVLQQTIDKFPQFSDAYWQLSMLDNGIGTSQLAKLESLVAAAALPHNEMAFACYTLASVYDKQKQYRKAFAFYEQGAKAKLATFKGYRPADELSELRDIQSAFAEPRLASGKPLPTSQPIFIVGMPRSGTTLAEQILASHSQITGADELYDLAFATQSVLQQVKPASAYPFWADELSDSDYRQIAQCYLALTKSFQQTPFFTDKMPLNFKAVGIIMRSFPDAKIIHCKRDKQDTIWGNFRQLFGDGVRFSYDLAHLHQYFSGYERLMDHWHELYGERIYTLEYETLVNNIEAESAKMFDYLGLKLEAACLEFHKSSRVVHTLSNQQVRKPLFREGMGRWKNYDFAFSGADINTRS